MAGLGAPTAGLLNQKNDVSHLHSPDAAKIMLNTCIHNYFLNEGKIDVANAIRKSGMQINQKLATGLAQKGNSANGTDDNEADSKVDAASIGMPGSMGGDNFILDWWSLFWDFWTAAHNRLNPDSQVAHFLASQQHQGRSLRPQANVPPYFPQQSNMMGMRMNMPKGVSDAHQRAMQNNLKNMPPRLVQNPMLNRDGTELDMNGQQRAQSPMAVDAPSPKRQRLDPASFVGAQQHMNPINRPPNAPQLPNGAMPTNSNLLMTGPKTIPPNFIPGHPGAATAAEMMAANGQFRGSNGGALADYQMQLMLLEQQNKKRLMMARQEQDVNARTDGTTSGQPGGMMIQQSPLGAPAMSPRGSRTGQSPGPNDVTKRGTPTLGTNSPRPDGTMPPGRISPGAANFDPNTMPPGMGQPGMIQPFIGGIMNPSGMRPSPMMQGPNGQYFTTPAAIEQFRSQSQGLVGPWPNRAQMGTAIQMAPHMAQQPQQQQQQQQQQNQQQQQQPPQPPPPPPTLPDASQPRNSMPPPTGPPASTLTNANNSANTNNNNTSNNNNTNNSNNATRNHTSSPQQQAAPATPSTTSKAAPKKNNAKDAKKKQVKKGASATGATPTSTAEVEETIPPTPITPQSRESFNAVGKPGPGQPHTGPPQGPAMQQPPPGSMNINVAQDNGTGVNHFGTMEQNDMPGFANMDFGEIGANNPDVLQDFDFDAFLQMDMDQPGMDFDQQSFGMNADGVETGPTDA